MAKKKAKKKPAPPGVDPNQRRRERLDARRQAKAEALAAKMRAERRRKLLSRLAFVGLAGAAGWFFFIRGGGPSEIRGHEITTFTALGQGDHVESPTYEERPPTTGEHLAQPAPCGIHPAVIPDGNLVHSFEHGAVALLYQPTLPMKQIRQLEAIAGEFDHHVISAPYEGMEPQISIASWAERMDLDEVDEPAIRDYIDEFIQDAPEKEDCDATAEEPFEPEEAPTDVPTDLPTGIPTELPTEAPTDSPKAKDSPKKKK